MDDESGVRFARLERAPAYKIVSDAILKDIIGGRLQIGNRLPSEQKLAEQFGVNRLTVREGIRLRKRPVSFAGNSASAWSSVALLRQPRWPL